MNLYPFEVNNLKIKKKQNLDGIEKIDPQGEQMALITFTSRKDAEAAIVKPIKVSGLDGIKVTWHREALAESPSTSMEVEAGGDGAWGEEE